MRRCFFVIVSGVAFVPCPIGTFLGAGARGGVTVRGHVTRRPNTTRHNGRKIGCACLSQMREPKHNPLSRFGMSFAKLTVFTVHKREVAMQLVPLKELSFHFVTVFTMQTRKIIKWTIPLNELFFIHNSFYNTNRKIIKWIIDLKKN